MQTYFDCVRAQKANGQKIGHRQNACSETYLFEVTYPNKNGTAPQVALRSCLPRWPMSPRKTVLSSLLQYRTALSSSCLFAFGKFQSLGKFCLMFIRSAARFAGAACVVRFLDQILIKFPTKM